MPVFRLIIRSSMGWSQRDQIRVLTRAEARREPPAQVTERGLELSVEADSGEMAKATVERAVHGIHSNTGVYLEEEIRP